MANEEIGAFKRNLRQLVAGLANDKASVAEELIKFDSWKDWISSDSRTVTGEHKDFLLVNMTCEAARNILRRRIVAPNEIERVKAFLVWAMEIAAINCAKGLDTDRIIMTILDPSQPLYVLFDAPETYAQLLQRKADAVKAKETAPGQPAQPPPAASATSSPQQQQPASSPQVLDGAWAAQLQVGDPADFRRSASDGWIGVRVAEIAPMGDVLRLERLHGDGPFPAYGAQDTAQAAGDAGPDAWVSIDSEVAEHHWARAGTFSGMPVAGSGGGAGSGSGAAPTERQQRAVALSLASEPAMAWRRSLAVGTLVDLQDPRSGKWWQAVIVEACRPADESAVSSLQAHLASAAPPHAAALFDSALNSDLCSYVRPAFLQPAVEILPGDEWLPRFSPRLAQLNVHSGGARRPSQQFPYSTGLQPLEVDQERALADTLAHAEPGEAAALAPVRTALEQYFTAMKHQKTNAAAVPVAVSAYTAATHTGDPETQLLLGLGPVPHELCTDWDVKYTKDIHDMVISRPWTPSPYRKGRLLLDALKKLLMHSEGGQACFPVGALLRRMQAAPAPAAAVGSKPTSAGSGGSAAKDAPHTPCPFAWVAEMTQAWGRVADCFTLLLVRQFVDPWCAAVELYVRRMGEPELRTLPGKEAMDALLLGLRRLLQRCVGSAEASRRTEALALFLGVRCVGSSQIMKQREGLKLLNELSQAARNGARHPGGIVRWAAPGLSPHQQQQQGPSQSNMFYRLPTTSHLTPEALVGELSAAGVLRDIFARRHHRELTKNSGELLRLLAETPGGLSPELLGDVWGSLQLSDGDDVDASVGVLEDVRHDLPPSAWGHLLGRIEVLLPGGSRAAGGAGASLSSAGAGAAAGGGGGAGLAAHHVRLLAAMAQSAGRHPSDAGGAVPAPAGPSADAGDRERLARRALSHLFSLALAPSESSPPPIAEAARRALITSLAAPSLHHLRLAYLRACVVLVGRHAMVDRALQLLRGVLDTFPQSRIAVPSTVPVVAVAVSSADAPEAAMAVTVPGQPLTTTEVTISEVLAQLQASHGVLQVLLARSTAFTAAARVWAAASDIPTWAHLTNLRPSPSHGEHGGAGGADSGEVASIIDDAEVQVDDAGATGSAPALAADDAAVVLAGGSPSISRLLGSAAIAAAPAASSFSSGEPFLAGIRGLLDFLAYALSHSPLLLSQAEAGRLWADSVGHAVTPSHRSLALRWFTQGVASLASSEGAVTGGMPTDRLARLQIDSAAASSPRAQAPMQLDLGDTSSVSDGAPTEVAQSAVFDGATALGLFRDRMASDAFVSTGLCADLPAFECWRAFFVYANGRGGALQHDGDVTLGRASGYRVASLELLGLDQLWNLTLTAADPGVAESAVSLLTSLHHRLADTLLPRIGDVRRAYVSRCMDFIRAGALSGDASSCVASMGWPWSQSAAHLASQPQTPAPGKSGAQLVGRCVSLLEALVDETQEDVYEACLAVREAARRLRALTAAAPSAAVSALLEQASAALRTATASHAPSYASVINPGSPGGPNVFPLVPPSASGGGSAGHITLLVRLATAKLPTAIAAALASSDKDVVVDNAAAASEQPPLPASSVTEGAAISVTTDVMDVDDNDAKPAGPASASPVAATTTTTMAAVASGRMQDPIRIRVSPHDHASEIRAAVAALTGLPYTAVRIALPLPSYSQTGLAAAVAASTGSGLVPLRGHLLGRSVGELGLKDGGSIIVMAAEASQGQNSSGAVISAAASFGTLQSTSGSPETSPGLDARPMPVSPLSLAEECELELRALLLRLRALPVALLGGPECQHHVTLLLSIVERACSAAALQQQSQPQASKDHAQAVAKIWALLCRLPTHGDIASLVGELASQLTGGDSGKPDIDVASRWAALLPCPSASSSPGDRSHVVRLLYSLAALDASSSLDGQVGGLPSILGSIASPAEALISRIVPPSEGALSTSAGAGYPAIYARHLRLARAVERLWIVEGGLPEPQVPSAGASTGALTAQSGPALATSGAPQLVASLAVIVRDLQTSTAGASSVAAPLSLACLDALLRQLSHALLAAISVTSPADKPQVGCALSSIMSAVTGGAPVSSFAGGLSPEAAASLLSTLDLPALATLLLTFVHAATGPEALASACETLTADQTRTLCQASHVALLLCVALCVYRPAEVWGAVSSLRAPALPGQPQPLLMIEAFARWALLAHDPRASSALHDHSLYLDSNVYCRLRATTAVALLLLALHTPAAPSQQPAGDPLGKTTPGGHVHPHALLLRTLFAGRPTHATMYAPGSAASPAAAIARRNVSLYFSLLEVLLRLACEEAQSSAGTPAAAASGAGKASPASSPSSAGAASPRLPTSLRTMLHVLAQQILSAPPVEDPTVARQAYGELCGTLNLPIDDRVKTAAGAASVSNPVPLTTALGKDVLSDPVSSAKQLLTGARMLLTTPLDAGLYAVAPMHPMFTLLGLDAQTATSADTTSLLSPTGTGAAPPPGVLPASQALAMSLAPLSSSADASCHARTVAMLQADVTPFAGYVGASLSEGEATACTAGVDHVLVGTLRLATALLEADHTLAAEVGSVAIPGLPAGTPHDLTRFLFASCLFPPTAAHDASPLGARAQAAVSGKADGGALVAVRASSASASSASRGGHGAAGPACHSLLARRAATRLLLALTRRCGANLRVLGSLLAMDAREVYAPSDGSPVAPFGGSSREQWRLEPLARDAIGTSDYVGLRNLGCICYQNALMQQFFMMEPLRYGVLSVPLGEALTAEERREHLLYQLQRMFGHLELSGRRAYDPGGWCHAYKDLDGQPTKVFLQQDAQEYLTTLLDRVEFALKGSPRAGLVQQVLGLQTREARFCTGGCGSVRTSSEPHVCLTIEVTRGHMGAALDALTAWEDVHGYDCEACGRKTTLRKRNTLDGLSNTLIVHLNRFEMNYETGHPSKLNNRFEFPASLNLEPYSYQAWARAQAATGAAVPDAPSHPPEYYAYDLVGVVVHTGTLESGHYYSFIKERGPRAAAKAAERDAALTGASAAAGAAKGPLPPVFSPGSSPSDSLGPSSSGSQWSGRWLEFNDALVCDFEPARIPEECYGGTQASTTWNAAAKAQVPVEVPVVKNAYMLVYERVAPQALSVAREHVPHLLSATPAASETGGASSAELQPLDGDVGMGVAPLASDRPASSSRWGLGLLGSLIPGSFGSGSAGSASGSSGSPDQGAAQKRARVNEGGASTTTCPPRSAASSSSSSSTPAASAAAPSPAPVTIQPWQLVPRDPASGRGYLPASIAQEVLADNGVLARNMRYMDPDFLPLLHLTADALSRHAATMPLPAATTVPYAPLEDAPLPVDVAPALRAAGATPRAAADASTASLISHYDFAETAFALTLHAFLPQARSAHGPTVLPHLAHTLCRLASHPDVGERLLAELYFSLLKNAPIPAVQAWGVRSLDWLAEAIAMPPFANIRASFGRLLASALMSVGVTSNAWMEDGEAFRLRALRWDLDSRSMEATEETTLRRTVRALLSLRFIDSHVATWWKTFDQFWAVWYDFARTGFGAGLPLAVYDPVEEPDEEEESAWDFTLRAVVGQPSPIVPAVSEALAAWTEGRLVQAPSALSPHLRPSGGAAARLGNVQAERELWGVLTLAGNRIRRYLVEDAYVPEKLLDLYLGRVNHEDMLTQLPLSAIERCETEEGAASVAVRPRRLVMASKTASPLWTSAFDLLALLVRSTHPPMAHEAPVHFPPTAVELGPVPRAMHGSIALPRTPAATAALAHGALTLPEVPHESADSLTSRPLHNTWTRDSAGFLKADWPAEFWAPLNFTPHALPALRDTVPTPFGADALADAAAGGDGDGGGAPAAVSSGDLAVWAPDAYSFRERMQLVLDAQKEARLTNKKQKTSTVLVEFNKQNTVAGARYPGVTHVTNPEVAEGSGLALTDSGEARQALLFRLLLGAPHENTTGDFVPSVVGRYPPNVNYVDLHVRHMEPLGPNPEAVAALLVHLCTHDPRASTKVLLALDLLAEYDDSSDGEDYTLPEDNVGPLVLLEAMACIQDGYEEVRHARLGKVLLQLVSDYDRSLVPEEAFVSYLILFARLCLLAPNMLAAFATKSVAKDLDDYVHQLARIEADPKMGWGAAPQWQAAAICAARRPEAGGAQQPVAAPASSAAQASTMAGLYESATAGQAALLRRLVGPATSLPLRDELLIMSRLVPMSTSLKATVALLRLQRVLAMYPGFKIAIPAPAAPPPPPGASGTLAGAAREA